MKETQKITLAPVRIDNETYYQISNVDFMRPFFISIMSDSNHWLFMGSNGGISAGRKDAENALFPYYTDDKIIEGAETTGSKTILRVQHKGAVHVWEPFSIHYSSLHSLQRNLYKNALGNRLIFEEVNHDLHLTFQYQWSTSNVYGFVKRSTLINTAAHDVKVSVVDGLQNIMPYGVGSALQGIRSNLVDAYKRNELDVASGIGIFSLSSIIVDKAEPSEALKANIAWSVGLGNATRLLSSAQLNAFRQGLSLAQEVDVKAEKGAYFVHTDLLLESKSKKEWLLVADVNKSAAHVASLAKTLESDKHIIFRIKEDIDAGSRNLLKLTAASDGLQVTADALKDTRHYLNTLFNIARGGIFDNNYQIERADLFDYLQRANRDIFEQLQSQLQRLPQQFALSALKTFAHASSNSDLQRLCLEYLPLKFSRRHGDPSRPWNQFSINTHNEHDGSKVLDYAGNWRDIFQNWEALAHSYPEFIDGMIVKFLNASTFDGYNPYRITKHGIDWERIEADDPWSYIGYWGDHQLIYLLKFLEFSEAHAPKQLNSLFAQDLFVYANVPYKIKPYQAILKNPKDTIDFDHALDHEIQKRWQTLGSDAALLLNKQRVVHHVNFVEKILATLLSKISNFIPEGGIWMNTQRPEWNDANNALVGNGVSVVTLCYLRRFLVFFDTLLTQSEEEEVALSEELQVFLQRVQQTLLHHQSVLSGSVPNTVKKSVLDGLGLAGSDFRWKIYEQSFTGKRGNVRVNDIREFTSLCLRYVEHTIRANKRSDALYHAYNLVTISSDTEVSISYLSEMLEGQVAVLSSGYLTGSETVETLNALKASSLFREDQQSYLLYPNKNLPGFLVKNTFDKSAAASSVLLTSLLKNGNTQIIEQDINGKLHFNGNFKNAADLESALEQLDKEVYPVSAVAKQEVLQLFESVFNHKAFTGRSGTFFGYEGLGSIYWHMVSKLQLAVEECCQSAIQKNEPTAIVEKLLNHFYEINEGIGVHKSPAVYGAFPTDPYSHTPANKGAQQPGMTGQVKEDILSRFGELGVFVKGGQLGFDPRMLRKKEFVVKSQVFQYVDVGGESKELELSEYSLAFTYCQVPVVYTRAVTSGIEVLLRDGTLKKYDSRAIDAPTSKLVFARTGDVQRITVHVDEKVLR